MKSDEPIAGAATGTAVLNSPRRGRLLAVLGGVIRCALIRALPAPFAWSLSGIFSNPLAIVSPN